MRRLYGVGRWGDPPNDYLLDKKLKEEEEEQLADTAQVTRTDHEEVR